MSLLKPLRRSIGTDINECSERSAQSGMYLEDPMLIISQVFGKLCAEMSRFECTSRQGIAALLPICRLPVLDLVSCFWLGNNAPEDL